MNALSNHKTKWNWEFSPYLFTWPFVDSLGFLCFWLGLGFSLFALPFPLTWVLCLMQFTKVSSHFQHFLTKWKNQLMWTRKTLSIHDNTKALNKSRANIWYVQSAAHNQIIDRYIYHAISESSTVSLLHQQHMIAGTYSH